MVAFPWRRVHGASGAKQGVGAPPIAGQDPLFCLTERAASVLAPRTFQLLRAPWIDVAIGSFLVLAPLGPLLINPRLHRIADTAEGEASGPISNALRTRTRDPLLALALGASLGILISLVFLMT